MQLRPHFRIMLIIILFRIMLIFYIDRKNGCFMIFTNIWLMHEVTQIKRVPTWIFGGWVCAKLWSICDWSLKGAYLCISLDDEEWRWVWLSILNASLSPCKSLPYASILFGLLYGLGSIFTSWIKYQQREKKNV